MNSRRGKNGSERRGKNGSESGSWRQSRLNESIQDCDHRHSVKGRQSQCQIPITTSRNGNMADRRTHQEKLKSNDNVNPAVGTCMSMCPENEILERIEMNEISMFEVSSSLDQTTPLTIGACSWAVKKYRRPAAGRIEIKTHLLRPPQVLLETLNHLFTKILNREGHGFDWSTGLTATSLQSPKAFLHLYHFLYDRLRSIRQDFVVQRVNDISRICALEQIVRFHILASLRYALVIQHDHNASDWSEALNDQQYGSALIELHALYRLHYGDPTAVCNQPEMTALNILLHAQDARTVSLFLSKVSNPVRRSPPIRKALTVYTAVQTSDFYLFFRSYRQLPVLQQWVASRHVPSMWQCAIERLNKAFGKQDSMKLEEIMEWLYLPSSLDAETLCRSFNLHLEANTCVAALSSSHPLLIADSWESPTSQLAAVSNISHSLVVKFKVKPLVTSLDNNIRRQLLARLADALFMQKIIQSTAWTLIQVGA